MNNVHYKYNPFTGWQTFLILLCSVVASYFVHLFFVMNVTVNRINCACVLLLYCACAASRRWPLRSSRRRVWTRRAYNEPTARSPSWRHCATRTSSRSTRFWLHSLHMRRQNCLLTCSVYTQYDDIYTIIYDLFMFSRSLQWIIRVLLLVRVRVHKHTRVHTCSVTVLVSYTQSSWFHFACISSISHADLHNPSGMLTAGRCRCFSHAHSFFRNM